MEEPWFSVTNFMRLAMPSTSFSCIAVGWLHATTGLQAKACDHPSSFWSHSRGLQWGSGLEIRLAMTVSWSGGLPSTLWLTWLCGKEHCPVGKTNPQSWGTLSEQREAGLIHTFFTKADLPDSSLAKASQIITDPWNPSFPLLKTLVLTLLAWSIVLFWFQ